MSDTMKTVEIPGTMEGKRTAHDYNIATWRFHLPKEIKRLGENFTILSKRHKSGIALGIQDAPKAKPDTPCIVIGSGPSADRVIPLLKDWNGGIICSTSQGMTLRYHGIEPDYMVALDSDSPPEELGPPSLWKGTKTALVSQPGVMTGTVDYWKWKSYWFRKYEPVADEPRIVYQMVQPLVFNNGDDTTWMQVQFVMLASVAPALCFVAKFLGYSPVFLAGIDFGWREPDHSRFQSYTMVKKEWIKNPIPIAGMADEGGRSEVRPYVADNGALTTGIQEFYKRNFLLAMRLDQWPVWDIGGGGALSEVPRLEPKDVIAQQGKLFIYPDRVALDEVYDAYLAKHNTYVVKWNGGMNFVESEDWQRDFPKAFGDAKRQGSKDTDIVANMRRFAKAHGLTVDSEMEAGWLATVERVSKAKDIHVALQTMDKRLMACVRQVEAIQAIPSIAVVGEVKRGVMELDAILKGERDVQ